MKLIWFFMLIIRIKGQFCPEKCSCMIPLVSCIGAINPKFDYDTRITTVYMANGYLDDVRDMVESFPNLSAISFEEMLFLNCDQLEEIPNGILVSVDTCWTSSTVTQGNQRID